ncbi:hypothetical protein [Streptomyces sp. NPDC051183]|uniref:hypothetical protein n=1 Tax=Streptomyces sp. NPDC051183 TaxID=3155165 RepID=UPI00342B6D71
MSQREREPRFRKGDRVTDTERGERGVVKVVHRGVLELENSNGFVWPAMETVCVKATSSGDSRNRGRGGTKGPGLAKPKGPIGYEAIECPPNSVRVGDLIPLDGRYHRVDDMRATSGRSQRVLIFRTHAPWLMTVHGKVYRPRARIAA